MMLKVDTLETFPYFNSEFTSIKSIFVTSFPKSNLLMNLDYSIDISLKLSLILSIKSVKI
jgi:hypothetical protein